MEKFEPLIRTMHTAKSARDKGMENIAEALDQWVKWLSVMIDAEIQSDESIVGDKTARKTPLRLNTRK